MRTIAPAYRKTESSAAASKQAFTPTRTPCATAKECTPPLTKQGSRTALPWLSCRLLKLWWTPHHRRRKTRYSKCKRFTIAISTSTCSLKKTAARSRGTSRAKRPLQQWATRRWPIKKGQKTSRPKGKEYSRAWTAPHHSPHRRSCLSSPRLEEAAMGYEMRFKIYILFTNK